MTRKGEKKMNKQHHLNLLAIAFCDNVEHQNDCEYGSIGLDCKRPFGNSYAQGDILEICQIEPEGVEDGDKVYTEEQNQYADELYQSLPQYFREVVKPFILSLTTNGKKGAKKNENS